MLAVTDSALGSDPMDLAFHDYETIGFYDEMFMDDGRPRERGELLASRLKGLTEGELTRRQRVADQALLNIGITFNVYGHEAGTEKIWPFDLIPRIIESAEWRFIDTGLKQRIRALNLFIDDIYHEQKIVRDGIFPEYMVHSSRNFLKQCVGLNPPGGIWCHITGTDLVRDADGTVYVLEDNLRCPSGVSYVLENREVMKRTFPQLFNGLSVMPVEDYPEQLLKMLQHIAPPTADEPTVVVLTPGIYNSAYFEHCFLAQQMGVELVQGPDLVVTNGYVHMRTTRGLERVDVIYRRIDDEFLDPLAFRADSCLGVPGLMDVYRAGRVALANAPGTGIADDKAVYAYVPQMIKYYLNEEMLLPNVPTYLCAEDEQRQYVLEHLAELVMKPANESGGYGILVGPRAPCEPAKLRGSADAVVVARTDDRWRSSRRSPCRSSTVYSLRRGDLHSAGRAHASCPRERFTRCEFVSRRRQQGYLGAEEWDAPRMSAAIILHWQSSAERRKKGGSSVFAMTHHRRIFKE